MNPYLIAAWQILKKTWPFLLAIGLIIMIILHLQSIYNDGVAQGTANANAAWQKKYDAAEAKNKELTQLLQTSLDTYSKQLDQQNQIRVDKENTHTNTITEIVKENPVYQQCLIDKAVIDQRNAIRALGPQP